ncbi:MAG: hypothetical protein ACYS80_20905 [Planctomycetota bacterium]|jgi:hypothetical protein
MIISENDYPLVCVNCQSKEKLQLYPHRFGNEVAGVFVMCKPCGEYLKGSKVDIQFHKKEEEAKEAAP